MGGGGLQHFQFHGGGLAALEAREESVTRLELVAKHGVPWGEGDVRALCAVLRRPRAAGLVEYLLLWCVRAPSRAFT